MVQATVKVCIFTGIKLLVILTHGKPRFVGLYSWEVFKIMFYVSFQMQI